VATVCELASVLVRTHSRLHEAATELRFLFQVFGIEDKLGLGGGRVGAAATAASLLEALGLPVPLMREDFQH